MWERKGNGVKGRRKEGRGESENGEEKVLSLAGWRGEGLGTPRYNVVPHQWQELLCSCVCQHARQ